MLASCEARRRTTYSASWQASPIASDCQRSNLAITSATLSGLAEQAVNESTFPLGEDPWTDRLTP